MATTISATSRFEEKQVHRAWNASKEKWMFAIVDVIAILTEGPIPVRIVISSNNG